MIHPVPDTAPGADALIDVDKIDVADPVRIADHVHRPGAGCGRGDVLGVGLERVVNRYPFHYGIGVDGEEGPGRCIAKALHHPQRCAAIHWPLAGKLVTGERPDQAGSKHEFAVQPDEARQG